MHKTRCGVLCRSPQLKSVRFLIEEQYYNLCTPISRADLQPGDLVLFTGTYNAGQPVTHCGIYVGNGQMIHAGDPVQYASIDAAYWQEHLYAFGRLPA